jgi:hypothetical protein
MKRLTLVLFATAVLPAPIQAQPSAARGGPWAADADGDGRITREELTAWMDKRFALMDQDGDGLVPVEVMQRMLGHERDRPNLGATGDRPHPQGRHRQGGRGGPGGGMGRHPRGGLSQGDPAGGGNADSDRPPPPGAMPWPEDSNDDGKIDRTEFLDPALAMFGDRDVNDDGVLTLDELSPPPAPQGDPSGE